jgi:hypothetical protein
MRKSSLLCGSKGDAVYGVFTHSDPGQRRQLLLDERKSELEKLLRVFYDPESVAGPLFLAPPAEDASDASASVERFLLLRVQAVIKRLKLGFDCL